MFRWYISLLKLVYWCQEFWTRYKIKYLSWHVLTNSFLFYTFVGPHLPGVAGNSTPWLHTIPYPATDSHYGKIDAGSHVYENLISHFLFDNYVFYCCFNIYNMVRLWSIVNVIHVSLKYSIYVISYSSLYKMCILGYICLYIHVPVY